jgi:hypothetical protein
MKAVRTLPGAAREHLSGAEVAVVGKLVSDVAPVAVLDASVATTSRFRLIVHGLLPE